MPSAAMLACLVIGIADGDTLTARCATEAGPTNIIVRLADIDAPEKAQAFGTHSRQHLAELCLKKRADIAPQAVDRYGRTVARVLCGQTDANIEQVRAGMAWGIHTVRDGRPVSGLRATSTGPAARTVGGPNASRALDMAPVQSSRCDGPPPWSKRCLAAAAL